MARVRPGIKWAYGVTTVWLDHFGNKRTERRESLLPRTLESLKRAGFDNPCLYVDGCDHKVAQEYETQFNLEVTNRRRNIRTFGNWVLALGELYIREPYADRYAMFQDDLVTYLNLKKYLEKATYGGTKEGNNAKVYYNLYSFPSNENLTPKVSESGKELTGAGFYVSNQNGRGAVGLIFDNETVRVLLAHTHMIERPRDPHRGFKAVDGGIVTALKKSGYKELVHIPSLTQHIGDQSSMGNKPHLKSTSFKSEDFDAVSLLSST